MRQQSSEILFGSLANEPKTDISNFRKLGSKQENKGSERVVEIQHAANAAEEVLRNYPR
ncbi:hypothetical protein ACU8KH_02177 [Lachancea thermotolerans]